MHPVGRRMQNTITLLFQVIADAMNIDSPPDLVIEIDATQASLDRLAAAGVPEVWRYSGGIVKILRLEGKGYVEKGRSWSVPHISSATLTGLVGSSQEVEKDVWIRQVRATAKKI